MECHSCITCTWMHTMVGVHKTVHLLRIFSTTTPLISITNNQPFITRKRLLYWFTLLAEKTQIQIALLYRSPSVPSQRLTNLLSRVLNHPSRLSLQGAILGDFKEDILYQTSPRIMTYMSSHGYTQLVKSPPTARGTFTDHVHCQ